MRKMTKCGCIYKIKQIEVHPFIHLEFFKYFIGSGSVHENQKDLKYVSFGYLGIFGAIVWGKRLRG